MDRRRGWALVIAVALGAAAVIAYAKLSRHEPAPDAPPSRPSRADGARDAGARLDPAALFEAPLGVAHCDVLVPTRRVRYDFDDVGRLVRRRAWRRPLGDGGAPAPEELTRYAYGAAGLELEVVHASLAADDDPYGSDGPGWRIETRRVEHQSRGEWLHQRTTDARGERERLFRVEDGRLALESPLRADEVLPESSRCQFDESGRPLRHRAASGRLTEWRYEGGVLARVRHVEPSGEAQEIAVGADGDGALTLLFDRYEGECAEVIFAPCSSVLTLVPGRPLPQGLLPGPARSPSAPDDGIVAP